MILIFILTNQTRYNMPVSNSKKRNKKNTTGYFANFNFQDHTTRGFKKTVSMLIYMSFTSSACPYCIVSFFFQFAMGTCVPFIKVFSRNQYISLTNFPLLLNFLNRPFKRNKYSSAWNTQAMVPSLPLHQLDCYHFTVHKYNKNPIVVATTTGVYISLLHVFN